MALATVSMELILIYFHSFDIFNIQIGEIAFCKPDLIIIKSNYFQNAQKSECFLDNFEALMHKSTFAVAKCHFEGGELKKYIAVIRLEI
jgi:hypothetical protein